MKSGACGTMYESFYGLKEKPFTLLPDPEYLYLSTMHQRALTLLEYGMMNKAGFSVICGEMGVGKTTLIRHLLTKLDENIVVGFIADAPQADENVLNSVILSFGLDAEGKNVDDMLQLFETYLIEQDAQHKQVILIVDEAHNLVSEKLEELRALTNITANKDQLLQIILVGQAGLREMLRQPELEKFAQRIAVDYSLGPLNLEETSSYISHRLNVSGVTKPIFTNEACDVIFEYSNGTPRLINLLCDTSLVYGYAEQSESIGVELVHDVVREQHGSNAVLNLEIDDMDDEMPSFVKQKLAKINNEQNAVAEHEAAEEVTDENDDVVERALKSSAEDKVHIELEKLTDGVVDAFDQVIANLDLKPHINVDNEAGPFKGGALPNEIYPMVHVENPKKGTKMLVVGMAAGVAVALLVMATAAWLMLGSNENIQQAFQQKFENPKQVKQRKAAEEEKFNTLQKQRDAAIAVSKKLKNERDAALKEAITQKKIREADLLLEKEQANKVAEEELALKKAGQEKEKALKAAEETIKKAELAQKKALEREHKLKLKVQKREAEIENQRLLALKEERKRLEAMALTADRDRLNELLSEEEDMLDEPAGADEPTISQLSKKIKDSFATNPCDGPSAKFLSTCKK